MPSPSRPRVDRFDLFLLCVLAALSMWTIGLALWQVLAHGLVWTGSETVFFEDGFQSMMWIQGVAQHGASPDLYVLGPSSADFVQPLVEVSGGLTALGLAPYLALLLWKPVAVGGVFFAARAFVRATLDGLWARRAALVLALFFGWGAVIGDSWIVFWSWGYPFALLGLTCTLCALLAYGRDRAAGRIGVWPPLLGALASWLHPWQGETLIAVLVGSELVALVRGERPRLLAPALTAAVAALPLVYFLLLVHFDPVWQREREVALSTYPIAHVAGTMWPLAIPALLAYRLAPSGFLSLCARVWLPVALALFLFSEWQGSGPTHALLGVTIPLGVLAVEGVGSLPWARVTRSRALLAAGSVALLAALTVPATVFMLEYAQAHTHPKTGRSTFITDGENAALSFLAHDRRAGGVLTRFYLGVLVPPATGRQTYVGNCYWSQPDCGYRSEMSEKLLTGQLAPARARAFVRATGARFVLGDCRSRNLSATLAPLLGEVRRFSCASVYVIRPDVRGQPSGRPRARG
ncbi:MAG TPA: hypothetical protein VGY13_12895 [Solirubrobacteraceae bacterium]|nr:hypothetical protein [Solirubrobacteraceae bacterium]